ncbi:hypothetical protein PVT67_16900 [Gallaecimonas kandeliae]|uniref:hypothetical protein n=1 Tax=Gallaecimonas kandeliae TaxID=3029055 RepID=UPI0026489BC5|nr:hypothetical protein [Gallaecimonas kandeliae]WKE65321.1 hypothetical protein PVT67_16900 [Gallaecimonas kandeliae]
MTQVFSRVFTALALASALLSASCSAVPGEHVQAGGKAAAPVAEAHSYIDKAKQLVRQYALTNTPLACLAFEDIGGDADYLAVVDVRELHNEQCPGDPDVSPRLFSVAFDKEQRVWTDAKSELGQMEPLGN